MFAPPLAFSRTIQSPKAISIQDNEICFSSCLVDKRVDSLNSITTEATQVSSETGCETQDLEGLETDVLVVDSGKKTVKLMVDVKKRGIHSVQSSPDLYAVFHAQQTTTEKMTRGKKQEHPPKSIGPAKSEDIHRLYEELPKEATDRVLQRNQALLSILTQLEKELESFSLREMKRGKPEVPMRPPRRSKLLARRSLGS